ncbi:endocytosis defective-related protein [Sporothrix curviconia]|uniref:Endocytosis defective-related protein n=1 Tax=Sporothrix curviconia TaxID=1260050 RepID=A0ABP0C591_9PEZI
MLMGEMPADKLSIWVQLPDNMKLLIIRDLSSLFGYKDTIEVLELSGNEEAAFIGLYEQEVAKYAAHVLAVRDFGVDLTLDSPKIADRPFCEPPRQHELLPGHVRSLQPPSFITDTVCRRDLKLAKRYLQKKGFDEGQVNLGH